MDNSIISQHEHHVVEGKHDDDSAILFMSKTGAYHWSKQVRDKLAFLDCAAHKQVLACIAKLGAAYFRQIERITLANSKTVWASLCLLERLGYVEPAPKDDNAVQSHLIFLEKHNSRAGPTGLKFYRITRRISNIMPDYLALAKKELDPDFWKRLTDYKRETLKTLEQLAKQRQRLNTAIREGKIKPVTTVEHKLARASSVHIIPMEGA